MTDAASRFESFDALRERIHDINYWWSSSEATYRPNRPGSIDIEQDWTFYKSDFFGTLDKLTWADGWRDGEDTRLFAITGPENTGKTTLLSQSIKLFVDEEFRDLLWTLPDADVQNLPSTDVSQLRAAWATDKYHHATKPGEDEYANLVQQLPELGSDRVLYLPLDADPAFQLRPERQIKDVVDYFSNEILDGDQDETRHYVFIDDIHTLASDPDESGWGELISELLEETPARKIVVTGIAEETVERELYDPERDQMRLPPQQYDIETVIPPKFRDYLQRRFPIFEGADPDRRVDIDYSAQLRGDSIEDVHDPDTYRLSGSDLRRSFQGAITEDDPEQVVAALTRYEEQLSEIDDWVGTGETNSPRDWITTALEEYLLLGGYLSLRIEDDIFDRPDREIRAYLRNTAQSSDSSGFSSVATDVLDETLGTIHEQAPAFDSIRPHRTRDLGRLYSWAAHTMETEPFEYDELLGDSGTDDWILDVDRRTLRNKYFDTLEQMVLLTFSDGYGNKKPRELRVALRDVGLANALCWRDLDDVTTADAELRSRLEYMVAFDHIMRLSYNFNHRHDPNAGVVNYWKGDDQFVEFIPKVAGAPIPIGLDTTGEELDQTVAAVGEFLDRQSSSPDAELHDFVRYEPTVGEPPTGPAGSADELLHWFDEPVEVALRESGVDRLEDLWSQSAEELSNTEGIDSQTATEIVDAVELYDMLGDVRGIGSSKREALWNPPTDGEEPNLTPAAVLEEPETHWTVETLAAADPDHLAQIPGFTETTAARVVEAAETYLRREEEESEYERRLDTVLNGDEGYWDGIGPLEAADDRGYLGRYERYEWGGPDGDENSGGSRPVHHRIHDGEAQFGIVLSKGEKIEQFQSPEDGKLIVSVPLWLFLSVC